MDILEQEIGGIEEGNVCEHCKYCHWKYEGHWCYRDNMPEPVTRNSTCERFEDY